MKLFWDTNLFIYLWEAPGEFFKITRTLHSHMTANKVGLVTSTLALGELQVGPKKSGNDELALRYKTAISQATTIVPFDETAADKIHFHSPENKRQRSRRHTSRLRRGARS